MLFETARQVLSLRDVAIGQTTTHSGSEQKAKKAMKTFVMTLVAAGAAAAAPAMAQYGYHDDSAHHRYAPATYSTGTTYNYAARPYAVGTYGAGAYGTDGHYDYDPAPVHGLGHGVSRPATVYSPSYNTGYGAYGGYRPAYPTASPAYRPASSWSHSDSAHHVYGW